jgi:hemolysin activation/secretion protein
VPASQLSGLGGTLSAKQHNPQGEVYPESSGSRRHVSVRFSRTSVAACALALGSALVPTGSVSAQAVITPPNRSDLIPPELRREQQAPTLTIDGDFERPPCALDRPEFANIRFTVAGAQFNGLDRVPGLSLEEAVADYKGREVPVSVLCDIRAEANAILRRQGYLATVEIPEQTLADSTPDFNVIFGRLTSVRVRGDAGPSEKLVAGYLEKLTAQDVFNTNQAERYLLLADDLPGMDVRLSLRPAAGGAPGDLVGEIAVIRQRGMMDLNLQNLGSRAIGRFGGVLRGEIYDVTGLGDRTSVALFSTLSPNSRRCRWRMISASAAKACGSAGSSPGARSTPRSGWPGSRSIPRPISPAFMRATRCCARASPACLPMSGSIMSIRTFSSTASA